MFKLGLENGILFQVEADEFINDAFHIRLKKDSNILSHLHLVPLWNELPNFNIGDFYQKNFNSYPKLNGNGRLLINTLREEIEIAIPFCVNIYSTSWVFDNNPDESDFITVDANCFWNRLTEINLAERIEEFARYRMIF